MSTTAPASRTDPPAIEPVEINSPEQLQRVMGTPYAPSEQQWAAISAPMEPAVVIAGAGSGKTTLMAARVVYLVLTGQVRPEQVLGLTFTTKAASELRRKVREALAAAGALGDADEAVEGALEPTVATYHSYAADLLTEHGLLIGHEPDTRVITDAARYQLGARVVDQHTGDIERLTDHPPTAIQNLLALDSAMSEHLVSPDEVRRFDAEQLPEFQRALEQEVSGKDRKTYRAPVESAIDVIQRRGELLDLCLGYRRLKRDLGLMDFADQIELAARLAAEQPSVGETEREKFRVVLLDEYQDTSVAQATMLSRLFSGPAGAGLGHAVTAVGDPNQAIYGWRGASASNILRFPEAFPTASGERRLFPLTVNRRSERRILEVANRLAQPLYDDPESPVRPLEPKPEAGDGVVSTAVHETRVDELDALAEAVTRAHDDTASWADIAVLTRDNTHAEDVFDTLTAAGVPVEIVGLSGLLRLPEVAEVKATLHLLHDVTDNAALLTLLTGPRWAVGPRDLRLLARRAEELAGRRAGRDADPETVTAHLEEIADGIDPAELPALDDALVDPGDLPYSPEALERFALLATELRQLRSRVGEPLLDLVRRIIDATGVDVELASAVSPAAASRRDNLDLFVKAVAEFQAVDGDVSLPALLAYLTAEDEQGNGLDAATPSEADSVKLLTVHRAKGLEWHSVFLVGVGEKRFPSNRSRMLWCTSPSVLPAPLRGDAPDLPQLAGHDKAALEAYRAATREHDGTEERRLGYVAFTRAAHRLAVSSFCWGPQSRPFGPSPFQAVVRDFLAELGEPPARWREKPDPKAESNPYDAHDPSRPWPLPEAGAEALRRREAAELVRDADPDAPDEGLDMLEAARVAEWDAEIERLLAEARAARSTEVAVELPASLSATALTRLGHDPDAFAAELARPMPRKPSRAARFGTRFHTWVEARFGQQALLDPDELAGRADVDLDDEGELTELIEMFEKGPFAERPPYAVEAPFALVLGGQVVRGRIDAVYDDATDGEPGFLLVDWKTNRAQTADPVQLAIYRQAWAELHQVPPDRVRAAFYYVRDAELVEPPDLPSREALARLLTGSG